MALPHALSGERGANRAARFPYVRARRDLEAVRAYLAGFAGQDATQRAYRRELGPLLWAVAERGLAVSSFTVEDCEAYKAFLSAPSAAFTGPPASRASGRWRPFAPGGLSPASQRYAVRALRAAFDWLVDVRYLAGNPWRAVSEPVAIKRAAPMRVERALSLDLWTRLRHELGARAGDQAGPQAARWRAARALLLLMGDAGLRVAEAATANREALTWLPADREVPGKGNKERFVPLSDTCVAALSAHWRDRGLAFTAADAVGALVAPLVVPPTPRARAKFGWGVEAGMDPDAVGQGGQGKQCGRSGVKWGGATRCAACAR